MAFKVLVLHGPNMNLLGQDAVDDELEARAETLGVELEIVQSQHEGGLLEALHEFSREIDAVLVNPGALAPQVWALAEGLRLVGLPAVEVLLAPLPASRGPSALAGVVKAQVHGKGAPGYAQGLAQLAPGQGAKGAAAPSSRAQEAEEGSDEPAPSPSRRGKSIGKKPRESAGSASSPARLGKTIGRKSAPPVAPGTSRSPGAVAQILRGEPLSLLTRAKVKEQITLRLKGSLSPEALAAWAREQWSALQRDVPCEAGARETLDTVLLTLMAGAKAGDHVLLAQMAKLDR